MTTDPTIPTYGYTAPVCDHFIRAHRAKDIARLMLEGEQQHFARRFLEADGNLDTWDHDYYLRLLRKETAADNYADAVYQVEAARILGEAS